MALDILIVDDERDIRELVAGVLSDEGYECRTAADSTSALEAVDTKRPSLVLLDVWLHGSQMDGLEVLDAIKVREPDLPVIIFSGHGNIDTAVSAVSRGAVDFIEKPFEAERLLYLVERATETERLRRENTRLRENESQIDEFTGNSAVINAVRATLKRVASTGSRVLVTGPAGAGKEVAARLLHSWSPRADKAFVIVNSARITPERFEEELFGEEADGKLVRPGLLETADGGTLYLDEVADMPLSTQARILRVLTEQSFVRVDSTNRCRRPRRLFDVARPRKRNGRKAVSRRPLLSLERGAGGSPIPGRATGRHPVVGRRVFRALRNRTGIAPTGNQRRSHGGSASIRLAGQCAPITQCSRADNHPDTARKPGADRGRYASGRSTRRKNWR